MNKRALNPIDPVAGSLIPAAQFQAVTFYDQAQKRQVIVLYALGQDGIIREFNNNQWNQYPILLK